MMLWEREVENGNGKDVKHKSVKMEKNEFKEMRTERTIQN